MNSSEDKAFPVPMAEAEIISLKEARRRSGKDIKTIKRWCISHGIGRRPGNSGPWQISGPALEMYLNGDMEAIEILRMNDRLHPRLIKHFSRLGLPPVPPGEMDIARKRAAVSGRVTLFRSAQNGELAP
ncbi:hypothetical protein [Agrobacterium genomosp. 13]|uniref:DNA-binding protein n=1 Tax=Agrobacterium genomosp. 13 str. CFBP 6927 TaxID=1183428 RepID=A0ABP2BGR7_9HYPH|nr:hypothetical protein [Agrobacterium genomosp. 13]CUX31916.1 conserved hypothetical protein [Agrobacterium genomosp. 13 str. CFBP 6927]